jgi:hypothetical protein
MLRQAVPEASRFPVDVRRLALEYTRQVFPKDPVCEAEGIDMEGCDGALVPIPGRGWGILYNSGIASPGRVNFTLGHEFGHYLVHRERFPEGRRCTADDIAAGGPDVRDVEREADQFASDLLMPFDDFRRKIPPHYVPDLDALSGCAHRYGVSLLAATLRWLAYTERRAVLAVSRDGFILWARSSEPAWRTGAFYHTADRLPVEIPARSLVASGAPLDDQRAGIDHPAGVWLPEACRELAVTSERYDFALSLLLLGDAPERRWRPDDEDGDPVAAPVDRVWR